jgi:MFS family permease
MNIWHLILVLIVLGIVSGHITHIMVSGVIFEGLRKRIKNLGEARGGFWALFSEGCNCQLCCGMWYSTIISLLWTIGLYVLRPSLWDSIAERPLGWITSFGWIGLFVVQSFFIAAIGHLFRELVGLIEDQRTKEEEETEVLEQTVHRLAG